jgi:hypothetical protein
VAIADQLLPIIDTDRDGQFSDAERAAYTRRVLKDLRLGLDEKVVALRLVDSAFPAVQEIRRGVGTIRIKATAPISPLATGGHALSLTNAHLPAMSVYLVNALVPKNAAIAITKQTRDEHQREYRLEFQVSASPP